MTKYLTTCLLATTLVGCAGKYLVKTYPSGAKVYVQDLGSKDKKLIGLSPVQIEEESNLGDVFFVVLEKEKYKEKSVMVRVNSGESLAISAQLDPVNPDDFDPNKQVADNEDKDKKDDPQQPPQQAKKDKKKDEDIADMKEEIADLNMRVALLENTTALYKDAIFSSRFAGGGPAKFDRDRNDRVIQSMFEAQQAIADNDLRKAEKAVNSAIKEDAYVTNAWLLKGSISFLKKDFENAKKAWERSLKLDPYNQMALKFLNRVYRRLGEDEVRQPAALRTPSSLKKLINKSRKPGYRSKLR